MNKSIIIKALDMLDEVAAKKMVVANFVICGGASLILQGMAGRSTKDIDIIEPKIPELLQQDIVEIAEKLELSYSWINNGPSSIINDLGDDWKKRIFLVYEGKNISVYSLSTEDLLFSKFWAMCDRQQDYADIVAINPTLIQLENARDRVKKCDSNPDWPEWVDIQFNKLKKELYDD